MFKYLPVVALIALGFAAGAAQTQDKSAGVVFGKVDLPKPDADGFITIFNGKDLTYWEGLPDYWTVKDGAISGYETKDKSKQTFLIFTGSKVSDFELR